jgi:hypothetical protein
VSVVELDDITFDLEQDGEEVRRMLHRRVWEAGAWATVAIAFQERRGDADDWSDKVVLLRMKKVHGAWKKHAQITLRADDARALGHELVGWLSK